MVHRSDFDLARVMVFDRVVGTVMSVVHFDCLCPKCQSQHLVSQADAKDGQVGLIQDTFDHWHGI